MKELLYLFKVISNLAIWVKVLLYLLISGVVIAIAGYFGVRAAVIAAICMLIIGLLIILFSILKRWVQERRAAELRGELEDAGGRLGYIDTSFKNRLEALRDAFNEGLSRFQMHGKDLYELPWYILTGEPQSGKTELVRHSDIEFPKNLHEDQEPKAQTNVLNWWFSNYGILLDTAGNVVFGEARGGATPEWRELLELLKRHRRVCPINGLVLSIPADSLLRDTPQEIERKAGILARQMDAATKELGVRFPVFVAVTKADKLPGFGAYFENLHDPKTKQQMFGWSNPAPLEAPFRPELVDDYLKTVAQRLRRRRLGFIMDPTPQAAGQRRADEVDSLFDLPESIEQLTPKLRRYVENIFVAGEWSSKPLYLRGIYFTSAMADPMPARAATPSVPRVAAVPQPAATAWEKKSSSHFIRDFLLDKVFREDSLVTRLSSENRSMFRNRIFWFVTGVILLAAFLLVAAMGYVRLSRNVDVEDDVWDRATVGWTARYWSPIVLPDAFAPDGFSFEGYQAIGPGPRGHSSETFAQQDLSLDDYLQTVVNIVSVPLDVPWMYKPFVWIGDDPNWNRFRAQKVLFEGSVVAPLLDAARTKMSRPPSNDGNPLTPDVVETLSTLEARALTELVRVEVDIIGREQKKFVLQPGGQFVPTLLEYVTEIPGVPSIIQIMDWTYSKNPVARERWAPAWTSGGNTLEKNTAIAAGLDRLVNYVKTRISTLQQSLVLLQGLADSASKYRDAENALAAACNIKQDAAASQSAVANAYENLEAAKISLEARLTQVRSAGLFAAGPENLSSALSNLTSGTHSHLGQVDVILQEIERVLPTPPPPPDPSTKQPPIPIEMPLLQKDPRYILLEEIRAKLTDVSKLIDATVKGMVTEKTVELYSSLDNDLFETYQSNPSYLWRWIAYMECARGAPEDHFNTGMYLVGQRWVQLGQLLMELQSIQTRVDSYTGSMAQPLLTICTYFLQRAEEVQAGLYVSNYLQQARDALLRVARFPLVWPPGPDNEALDVYQLKGSLSLLQAIAEDLRVPVFANLPVPIKQPLLDFTKRLNPLYGLLGAMIKPDGSMAKVSVVLYNGQAQKQLSGPNFTPLPTPAPTPTPPRSLMRTLTFGIGAPTPTPPPPTTDNVDLNTWNAVELLGAGAGGVYPLDSPSDTLLGVFSLEAPFSFRVYHSMLESDGTDLVDGGQNWSAFRLMARLGAKPIGVGQDWQLALKPNEPNGVWLKLAFELPLPTTPWPTLDTLGLRQIPGSGGAPTDSDSPFGGFPGGNNLSGAPGS